MISESAKKTSRAAHAPSGRSSDLQGLGEPVLVARGLSKEFRGFQALSGVDLSVARGSIHALIGPNGAGKTTCFNLLTKFLAPSSGEIIYKGRDITRTKPADVARLGLVRSFQISAVFGRLTVLENVRIALQRRKRGDSFDFWRSERVLQALDGEALALLEEVGLAAYSAAPALSLSYGRKRALEIATTLALDPDMLLLDEPMAGMGREDVEQTASLIRHVSVGRTILMVEHNLSVVAELSDRITVLARGRVLAEGDYAAVSKDPRVVEAYLGARHD
jgi:branched-chain amino acid transport system ATP-binding protein